MQFLDTLSTPSRQILGGRDVNVLNQTAFEPWGTTTRVVVLILSVIVFPIILLSTAALLVKTLSFPWFWQKKIVVEQSKSAWKNIEAFENATSKENFHNWRNALEVIKQHPEICERGDNHKLVFAVVNRQINEGAPWKEVANSLQYLSYVDRRTLINHAVKIRLDAEFKDERYLLTIHDIGRFIAGSFPDQLEEQAKCFDKLVQEKGALSFNLKDTILNMAVKWDLAWGAIGQYAALGRALGVNPHACNLRSEVTKMAYFNNVNKNEINNAIALAVVFRNREEGIRGYVQLVRALDALILQIKQNGSIESIKKMFNTIPVKEESHKEWKKALQGLFDLSIKIAGGDEGAIEGAIARLEEISCSFVMSELNKHFFANEKEPFIVGAYVCVNSKFTELMLLITDLFPKNQEAVA